MPAWTRGRSGVAAMPFHDRPPWLARRGVSAATRRLAGPAGRRSRDRRPGGSTTRRRARLGLTAELAALLSTALVLDAADRALHPRPTPRGRPLLARRDSAGHQIYTSGLAPDVLARGARAAAGLCGRRRRAGRPDDPGRARGGDPARPVMRRPADRPPAPRQPMMTPAGHPRPAFRARVG